MTPAFRAAFVRAAESFAINLVVFFSVAATGWLAAPDLVDASAFKLALVGSAVRALVVAAQELSGLSSARAARP